MKAKKMLNYFFKNYVVYTHSSFSHVSGKKKAC